MCEKLILASPDPSYVDSSVIKRLEELGYCPRVVRVDSLEPENIAKLTSRDIVIVPGSSPYDYSPLKGLVVKGPYSPRLLPFILKVVTPSMLSPTLPAEKAIGGLMGKVSSMVLEEVYREASYSFSIGGVKVPLRPPPFIVIADLYAVGRDPEATLRHALNFSREGADIVVFSWSYGLGKSEYLRIVKVLVEGFDKPLGVDVPFIDVMIESLNMGAQLGLSLTLDVLEEIPKNLREDRSFVLLPRSLDSPRKSVEDLKKCVERARQLGFEKIIVDPVFRPPLWGGLRESIERLRLTSHYISEPIMVGLNNVYEMMDADTPGSIALLTFLVAELGASLLMGSEESCKSRGSISEVKTASLMASLALYLKAPPKDLGVNLLRFKRKKC